MKEEVKNFLRAHEKTLITYIAFLCVFILGFFAGRVDAWNERVPTITIEKPQIQSTIFKDQAQQPANDAGASASSSDCPTGYIKGNISASSKVYHLPGGSFYQRTQAEQCFGTEAEARAAGFRKSSR